MTLLGSIVAVGGSACGASPPAVAVVDVPPPRAPAPAPSPRQTAPSGTLLRAEASADASIPFDGGGGLRIDGAGFHYVVPNDWHGLDPADLGSALIRSAQRNPQPVDGFMTNVNVAAEPFVGDGPAYADANLIELRKVATIRDQRAARAGDRPAGDIEADWPNPGGIPYVTLQRYATNGREGFVITCSSAATAFVREKPRCERILDSFRVE